MMKLSISNIAWDAKYDEEIYSYMRDKGFVGLEIAPTKIIKENPYSNLEKAYQFKEALLNNYGLKICSMQSIWFGMNGNIFNDNEAHELIDYTKKAILFAEAIECGNLVFGCPKNRNMKDGSKESDANSFFEEISSYAVKHNTQIALEANPVIYNTNFINTTSEAFNYIKKKGIKNLKVNLDLGTIIYNDEDLSILKNNIELVNHIHISEPNLVKIKKRELHHRLKDILDLCEYKNYISIEMKTQENIEEVKETIDYISEVFI